LIEKKGIGLLNMQSRVKSIGGQMDMTSQIGSGMNVKIKITEKVTNSILHT
jgi:signal transduction histidine kinase